MGIGRRVEKAADDVKTTLSAGVAAVIALAALLISAVALIVAVRR